MSRQPTRQQQLVLDALDRAREFRSAQQLYAELRASGERVGLTTVYRALQALATDGAVDVLRTDGEVAYRRCARTHHHHLVCRSCGRTVEVTGPAVERWADQVARDHGFQDVEHTLEVFGTCGACATA